MMRSSGYLVQGVSNDDLTRVEPAVLSSLLLLLLLTFGGSKVTSSSDSNAGRKVSNKCLEFDALSVLFGTAF
jgi:hypothetical protein